MLKYLLDRRLKIKLIQLVIPRTKSSIQQRMSKVHDIENITYNPKGFPGVRCDYSKNRSISNDVKVGKFNMNNIGESTMNKKEEEDEGDEEVEGEEYEEENEDNEFNNESESKKDKKNGELNLFHEGDNNDEEDFDD